MEASTTELTRTIEKLGNITKHNALILLRYSLSATRLLHILRCCPCTDHPGLVEYDAALRTDLSKVLNLPLSDDAWLQASLPVKMGGLGIRSVTSLALPAFLASAASTDLLQSTMLGNIVSVDPHKEQQLARWLEAGGAQCLEVGLAHKHSAWDRPLIDKVVSGLHTRLFDPTNQARLKVISAPHAGDWLLALPITNCGLRLDDESIRVAVGLRLGFPSASHIDAPVVPQLHRMVTMECPVRGARAACLDMEH